MFKQQAVETSHNWINAAWWLYECMPLPLLRALVRSAPYVLPWLEWRVPIAVLRGPTQPAGQPGLVVVAGAQPWCDYLPRRFFTAPPQREVVGKAPVWALPRILARWWAAADLIVVRVDRLSAQLFFSADYLCVPEWVSAELSVPNDLADLARQSHSVWDDLRVMRRHGLTPEVSYTLADLETFYHTMYVPFVRQRHGDEAVVRHVYQFRRYFRGGGILWVRQEGRRVAGVLFQRQGDTFRFLAVGTVNGEWAPVKAGAMAALYYYAIERARDLGCRRVDFGGSRPVLNDGVLRYKRKWGMRVTERPDSFYDWLIHWERVTEPVATFLSQMPLIFRDAGELSALATFDNEGPAAPSRAWQVHRSLWMPGLRRLYVMSPSGWSAPRDSTPSLPSVELALLGDCQPRTLAMAEAPDHHPANTPDQRSVSATRLA